MRKMTRDLNFLSLSATEEKLDYKNKEDWKNAKEELMYNC